MIADEARRFYGTQFHPEVVHTPDGGRLLANFVRHVCGMAGDWTHGPNSAETKIAEIRAPGPAMGGVICGLSGGVDSAVRRGADPRGDRPTSLTCVFVDHGLMRMNEADQVVTLFRDHYNTPLVHVEAEALFLGGLAGLTDPGSQAQVHRQDLHRCVRGRGQEDRRRGFFSSRRADAYSDVIEKARSAFTGGPGAVTNHRSPPQWESAPRLTRTHEHANCGCP